MKALTLHQPWASLVALGVKTVETRPWQTKYRGELAIHAGKHRPTMMHLPPLWGRQPEPSFLCIDTITDPKHQRPHRTDIRDRVPKSAQTPTLFFPHRGPHARPHKEGTSAIEQGSAILLPLGAVVATCTLDDVIPMTRWDDAEHDHEDFLDVVYDERFRVVELTQFVARGSSCDLTGQLPYGDYRPGRFAWLLSNIKPLDPPVPAVGQQQIWEWEPEREEASA